MISNDLNLARLWRSKNLDEIIGQEIVIRLLKNSLYKNYFFPVYLLSGQRGCGKTTTARVFAGAINCEHLEFFQKSPQTTQMPCLVCTSCKAMQASAHPDFIEIDAASHTGVDNVRALIETASFLPLMGRKKIYLIDEAHMLSKAAFNAFLKILEEPPRTVLFLLATTDPEKIIDTVKSRSFQLFFEAINTDVLTAHLKNVCEKEDIKYEEEALHLLVQESSGSARDALNIIERVRLFSGVIDLLSVKSILKLCDDHYIIELFSYIIMRSCNEFLAFYKKNGLEGQGSYGLWKKSVQLLQALVHVKHGFEPEYFKAYTSSLKKLADQCSFEHIILWLELCYTWEMHLYKTIVQSALLEMLFLKMIETRGTSKLVENIPLVEKKNSETVVQSSSSLPRVPLTQEIEKATISEEWEKFLKKIKTLEDPLLNSIFIQGIYINSSSEKMIIEFSKEFSFFKELLHDTKNLWYPFLEETFGKKEIVFQFIEGEIPKIKTASVKLVGTQSQEGKLLQEDKKKVPFSEGYKNYSHYSKPKNVSQKTNALTDLQNFPTAQLLMHIFPGMLSEIKEQKKYGTENEQRSNYR